jgi:CheY-like chemotaxis protein
MPGEKILVVDDEQEIRELLVKCLTREGLAGL